VREREDQSLSAAALAAGDDVVAVATLERVVAAARRTVETVRFMTTP